MGGSLPSRKNPLHGYGIGPGLIIQLELTVGNRTELYASQVEEITANAIGVLVPMRRLQRHPLPSGSPIRVGFVHNDRRRRFVSQIIGHSADGNVDYLQIPTAIDDNDRRQSFRLDTALDPDSIFRLLAVQTDEGEVDVSIAGSVVNISEGGLCFTTRNQVRTGERLAIQLQLPETGQLNARLRVTNIEEPNRHRWSRRVHCEFTSLTRRERDLLARFLVKRQLELRRRGQL